MAVVKPGFISMISTLLPIPHTVKKKKQILNKNDVIAHPKTFVLHYASFWNTEHKNNFTHLQDAQ